MDDADKSKAIKRIAAGAPLHSKYDSGHNGRKKIPDEQKRTVRISVNMTEKMKEAIERKKGCLSDSNYILSILEKNGVFDA